jgi:hypothetical protein
MDTKKKKEVKEKKRQKMNELRIYNAIKKITDTPFNQGESFDIKIPKNVSMDDIQWDLQMSKKPEPELEEFGYIPQLKKYEKYCHRRIRGELSKEFEEINKLNPYFYIDTKKRTLENTLKKKITDLDTLFFENMGFEKKKFEELINKYFLENKFSYYILYNIFENNKNLTYKNNINYLRITNPTKKNINSLHSDMNIKGKNLFHKNIHLFKIKDIQNQNQLKKIYNINSITNFFKNQYHKMDIIYINFNAYYNTIENTNKKYYSLNIALINLLYLITLYQLKGGSFILNTYIYSNKVFSDIIYLISILYEDLIIEKDINNFYTLKCVFFKFHNFKGITDQSLQKLKDICIQLERKKKDGYVDILQIITNKNPIELEIRKLLYYFQKKLYEDIKNKLYILQTFKKINQIDKIKYEKIIIKKQIQFLIYIIQYLENKNKLFK